MSARSRSGQGPCERTVTNHASGRGSSACFPRTHRRLDVARWIRSRGRLRSFLTLASGVGTPGARKRNLFELYPSAAPRRPPNVAVSKAYAKPCAQPRRVSAPLPSPGASSSSSPNLFARPVSAAVPLAFRGGDPPSAATTPAGQRQHGARAPGPPQRLLAPVVKHTIRGSLPSDVLDSASREALLEELDEDMLALSSKATVATQLATWEKLHHRWFGFGARACDVWPLTTESLRAVTAQLKSAAYRSSPNYVSAAKRRHIELAFPWTEDLAFCQRTVLASTQRGIGAPKQCAELCILAVHQLGLGPEPLVEGGPICPSQWAVLASFHLMRGAESAAANNGDLTFNEATLSETMRLPVSKTDTLAAGVSRTWGCVCIAAASGDVLNAPCPYCAAVTLAERSCELFATEEGFVTSGTPLFPNAAGGRCSRQAFVATVLALAALLGASTVDSMGRLLFGEHVWRVSGARHMNRNGIDLPTLMRLARWGSNVVLRYLADAPLSSLTLSYRRSALRALQSDPAASGAPLTASDVERIVASRFCAASADRTQAAASLEALIVSVDSLAASVEVKHASLETSVAHNAAQLGVLLSPKFALSLKSGKYHAVRCGVGFDHRQWRTVCGMAFGGRPDLYEVCAAIPSTPTPLRCFNCFGAS